MASTMQPIEGASLLSALADLFFKGLDNALTAAAEYQEEMGVLKQINRIDLESLDGKNKYTLTIKLSPVRGKDSFYFVEAETDAPGLDVSKIDNKTMKISKENAKQFRDLVDKLISSSNYAADMDRSDDASSEEAEVVGEPADGEERASEEGSVAVKGSIQALVQAAEEWLDEKPVIATKDGILASINIEFVDVADPCVIEISATDAYENKGQDIKSVKPKQYEIDMSKDDGNIIDEETFFKDIESNIDRFLNDNGFKDKQHVRSSTVVSATFIKNGEEVSLTAVKASSNIDDSMELVYELADDPEFVDQLVDGKEASFEITDNGEEFEVDTINNVDQSESYIDFYKEVSKIYITFRVVESMLGSDKVRQDSFFNACYWALSDIQNKAAEWVSNDVNINPILQDPFQIIPTVEQYRNIGEDAEVAKARLAEDINKAMDRFNFLAVNLSEDDQLSVDCWINRMDQILAYK